MSEISTENTIKEKDPFSKAIDVYIQIYYKPNLVEDDENEDYGPKKHYFRKNEKRSNLSLFGILERVSNLFHNRHREMTFSEKLMNLIEKKGMKPIDVYKNANINKQNFSKIKNDIYYQPSKGTAIALAIALQLDLDETRDLLRRAGFTLSHTIKSDVIVEFFIDQNFYDVDEINIQLHERGLAQLTNSRKMKDKNNADSKNVSETDSSSD